MRRTVTLASALAFAAAACQAGQPEQEQNLSERGSAPEMLANDGAADIAPGTLPATEQANMGDTMPYEPAGPRGDRGSGTGGDSTPAR